MARLKALFAQCVRQMCGISPWTQRKQRISNESLRGRIGIASIAAYMWHRQLVWVGCVSRMGMDRMPRKILSSWCYHRRPVGGVRYTIGRGMLRALAEAGIAQQNWWEHARDEHMWNTCVCVGLGLPKPKYKRKSRE